MIKNIVILITGLLALSTASILIRFCTDVPPIMIATYRMAISAAVLLVINAAIMKKRLFSAHKNQIILCIIAGLFLALHFTAWIASLKHTSVANSVVLVTTNPIFVGIFSWLIFKERHSIYLLLGILMSFGGTVIMVFAKTGTDTAMLFNSESFLGDMLALAGAVMASGYLIIGSRVRKKMGIMQYITLVYTFCALFLLVFSLVSRTPFTGYSKDSYIYMLLLAVIPQLIGHTSFNWGLKHISSTNIAVTILGEPVGTIILAYTILHETISLNQGLGILLIFSAIILSYKKGRNIVLKKD